MYCIYRFYKFLLDETFGDIGRIKENSDENIKSTLVNEINASR